MTAVVDYAANYAAVEARAKELAELGGNYLFLGPLSLGSTMIARRVVNYLPEPSILERAWIEAEFASVGYTNCPVTGRPFRAPHHTVSAAGLVGKVERRHLAHCASLGDPWAKPCDCAKYPASIVGEVRLARFGVLFLDELPEFSERAVRALADELKRMGSTRPRIIATAHWRLSDAGSDAYRKRAERFAEILGLEVLL